MTLVDRRLDRSVDLIIQRFLFVVSLLLPQFLHLASASEILSTPNARDVRRDGSWIICESEHFEVWCHLPASEAVRLAERCEALRSALARVWLEKPAAWSSRCAIVVSENITEYGHAIGDSGNTSVGCTTLQTRNGSITFRRIDLRADARSWQTSALHHEMTHIVLADRFGEKPLPLWADEGLSVLSEPPSTRTMRELAFEHALKTQQTFSLESLLAQAENPRPPMRDIFYSQSALLVALLIERGTPRQLMNFMERSGQAGLENALTETYGIKSVGELEELWSQAMNHGARSRRHEVIEQASVTIYSKAASLPLSAHRQ